MTSFELDARLAADSLEICDLETCNLRLMNDSRWPWLILVPRLEGAIEWHELFSDQRQDIDLEIANVASILKAYTNAEKVNIGSLGNIVRQLHIHIIARQEVDPNWPGPVWGYGERARYREEDAQILIDAIRKEL